MFHSPAFAKAMAGKPTPTRYSNFLAAAVDLSGDGESAKWRIQVRNRSNTRGLDMKIWYRCPDEGRPGAANAPDYAVETAAFAGDWWTAAKRYRKWAIRQQWASKGPLKDRKDFCKRIGNVGYWMICYSGKDAGDVANVVAKMQAALPGVPLGFHWYNWHNSPFDVNYPEMFPARGGFKEAAAWMKENGVFCMPYINGSLWGCRCFALQKLGNLQKW